MGRHLEAGAILVGIALLGSACMGGRTPTTLPSTSAATAAAGLTTTPSRTAVVQATATSSGLPSVAATETPTRAALPSATVTAAPSATRTEAPETPTPAEPTAPPVPTLMFTETPTPTPGPVVRSLVVAPTQPPMWLAVIDEVLYRTDDRGVLWTAVSLQGLAKGAEPTFVAIDYRNPDVVYLATTGGLYRRVGDGDWAFLHSYNLTALAVDMVDSNVLWAGIPYSTGLQSILVRSDDGGRTWGKADSGLPGGYGLSVGNIAIDPKDPNILFLSVRDSGRFGWPSGVLYRGARNGYWQRISLGRFDIQPGEFRDYCSVNGLAVDPNLRTLYVGCDQYYYNKGLLFLIQSGNASATDASTILWDECSRFGQPSEYALGAARPLAVDAREPSLLFVAVSEPLYSSSTVNRTLVSRDGGVTWVELSLGSLPR